MKKHIGALIGVSSIALAGIIVYRHSLPLEGSVVRPLYVRPAQNVSPTCGNNICESAETAQAIPGHMGPPYYCPQDCKSQQTSSTTCGNGTCESNETARLIPGHVGPPYYCPQDCKSQTTSGTCGDGVCQSTETALAIPGHMGPPYYCPQDCKQHPAASAVCGNGTCEAGEANKSPDCKAGAPCPMFIIRGTCPDDCKK